MYVYVYKHAYILPMCVQELNGCIVYYVRFQLLSMNCESQYVGSLIMLYTNDRDVRLNLWLTITGYQEMG